MALDPALAAAIAGLQNELASISSRVQQVEVNQRASQLANSSVDNGSITFNDAAGNPQVVLGLQPDGTFAHASVTSQTPAAPSVPLTSPGVMSAVVTWDGVMSDGSFPLADFAGVQIHLSTVSGFTLSASTLQGALTGPGSFGIGALMASATYYAVLVAYNTAGNTSPPSAQAAVVPQSVPANIPQGAITGLQIQTGAISSAQLAANAGILGQQIASQTITGANIQAGSVTTNLLAAGIIIAGVIDGTVVNAPVINGGVINGVMINATNINGGTISATTFTGTDFIIDSLGLFFYNGTPVAGNPPVTWMSPGLSDPFGATLAATTGVTELAVLGGSLPPAPPSGVMVYSDSSGNLGYVNSLDSNAYRTGRFVVFGNSGQLMNNTSATNITGGTVTLVAGTGYHVICQINFTGASASGAAQFGFGGGTALISHADGGAYFTTPGVGLNNASVFNGSLALAGSAAMTGGNQRWWFDAWLTCSAGGTLPMRGNITTTNFTVNSIYIRVETFS